jgi:uncharacterized protein YeaO (DUF488 family)
VWPRGVTKGAAALDLWLKDVAPSAPLRKWYGHEPARWAEFQTRYRAELTANEEAVARLRSMIESGPVTLLYAARDESLSHAVVLRDFMRERLRQP